MTRDTRIALFLLGELVAALRAKTSDLFKRWLPGGVRAHAKAPATAEAPEEAMQALGTDLAEGDGLGTSGWLVSQDSASRSSISTSRPFSLLSMSRL
ncbi:hypothetical protein [Synechococcus sp. MU1625]|uniref:hypothetical protein n=1 Tax=Synechococcus sp. MU1625 TaxID=2508347 RepID=UPI001CF832E3|nr:hypothetical protein [Synechococcus sp. MU1625]